MNNFLFQKLTKSGYYTFISMRKFILKSHNKFIIKKNFNYFSSKKMENLQSENLIKEDQKPQEPIQDEAPDKTSKKAEDKKKKKNEMKLNKKLAQGIKSLCNIEKKPQNELITEEPTDRLIVIHFGLGEEIDHTVITSYIQKFLTHKNFSVEVFPGYPHGFIKFGDINDAINLIQNLTKIPDNKSANSVEINYNIHRVQEEKPDKPKLHHADKIRNTFFFYTKLTQDQICKGNTNDIPNALTTCDIPGITLYPDFITEQEEYELFNIIDQQKWASLSSRRVQHYGYEFLYGPNKNFVNKDNKIGELPEWTEPGLSKLNELTTDINNGKNQDQLTVNDYYPGDGIAPHVDSHSPFMEAFASQSLGSGCVMSFKNTDGELKHIFFPPRCAVVFSGEGRYAWTHTIACRKIDRVDGSLFFRRRRISLTYRAVRKEGVCKCKWPIMCDGQGYDPVNFKIDQKGNEDLDQKLNEKIQTKDHVKTNTGYNIDNTKADVEFQEDNVNKNTVEQVNIPGELEKKYVYEVYDKIADHFSSTRYKPWPLVVEFLDSLEEGSLVGDIGCGNGKYLFATERLNMVGSDISVNFAKICHERGGDAFVADSLNLPIKTDSLDHAITIAVIHHFSTPAKRIRAIEEIVRVVKPGGKVLIYVWAMEQEEKKFAQQDIFVPWNLQKKFDQKNKNRKKGEKGKVIEGEKEDVIMNQEKDTKIYKRYYHVFYKGELEELCKQVQNCVTIKGYFDHANWVVVLQKNGSTSDNQ